MSHTNGHALCLVLDQVLDRLADHLPEGQRSQQDLRSLAHSPHFQQQLAAFSSALQTGQLDLAQFGLQAEVGLRNSLNICCM
jgi:hypothetical protein